MRCNEGKIDRLSTDGSEKAAGADLLLLPLPLPRPPSSMTTFLPSQIWRDVSAWKLALALVWFCINRAPATPQVGAALFLSDSDLVAGGWFGMGWDRDAAFSSPLIYVEMGNFDEAANERRKRERGRSSL